MQTLLTSIYNCIMQMILRLKAFVVHKYLVTSWAVTILETLLQIYLFLTSFLFYSNGIFGQCFLVGFECGYWLSGTRGGCNVLDPTWSNVTTLCRPEVSILRSVNMATHKRYTQTS